jgi:DNA mismatch repair protein MutS
VRAKTLFATHYHELTTLADHLERVVNVHVAADERDGDVTFLRTVREGPTDRSYGVHVADLAGVPAPVVERSREVLDRLRDDEAIEARGAGGAGDGTRQVVFDLESGELRAADDPIDGAASGAREGSASRDSESASGAAASDGGATAGEDETAPRGDADVAASLSESQQAVLAELADVDLAETTPVELVRLVDEWQDELAEE